MQIWVGLTNFAKRIKPMSRIVVEGLTFVPYIPQDKIQERVREIGAELRKELEGKKPVFLCVLNGAFVFAADLIREIGMTDSKIQFVKYSSYEGTASTGKVKQILGLNEDVKGKDIIIIEDIVDTGLTAVQMINDLKEKQPNSVKFVTLLHKPEKARTDYTPDYVGFSIPPKFIIGYGLDLDGKARNLKDIYVIEEDSESH